MVVHALPHRVMDAKTFQKLHHIAVFGGWIAHHALLERHEGHPHIGVYGACANMFFLKLYLRNIIYNNAP
jgi:hypothetical protein